MSETKYHPPIPTVSDWDMSSLLDEEEKEQEEAKKLKPMDLCYSNNHPYIAIGVVLMGPMNIPYFEDGCASSHAFTPLDIQNPEEWTSTFSAYIVFDLNEQIHKICSENNLKKMELSSQEGYIPYDHGTSNIRCNLGLIELANKLWDKNK